MMPWRGVECGGLRPALVVLPLLLAGCASTAIQENQAATSAFALREVGVEAQLQSTDDARAAAATNARTLLAEPLTADGAVQIAVGYGLWTAGAGFQLGCEQFGALTVPVGAGNLEIHLQMLTDLGTTCLCSTASMALLMGEEVLRHGLSDKVRLNKVIFGAEGHNEKMRRAFEKALGVKESFDIGGMTEMYGPARRWSVAPMKGCITGPTFSSSRFLTRKLSSPSRPARSAKWL